MIIKARIKDFKDIPEQEKCCDVIIKAILPYCGTIVELLNKPYKHTEICSHCKTQYKEQIFLPYANGKFGLPISCIDIDEGQPLQ